MVVKYLPPKGWREHFFLLGEVAERIDKPVLSPFS